MLPPSSDNPPPRDHIVMERAGTGHLGEHRQSLHKKAEKAAIKGEAEGKVLSVT